MPAVDLEPLALPVGAEGPAHVRPFVPDKAQPAQGLEDHPLAGGMGALAVGVLDAQQELAARLLGERVVEERDVGGADVRVARGRRCDACPDQT